ncbi:hypothetical protein [Variovorax sp. Sphag1AA]|uniref:hypothetical protein n=1 Tax=Variovorax sp. Sphag1AA TaxID=2587027 RepID=UPI00160D1A30|nr:hypothetical protein [Variovorax sp. Sphag1AA]MBB3176044.1 hypothetical protein [Variovorax sp. Sphag1AA]
MAARRFPFIHLVIGLYALLVGSVLSPARADDPESEQPQRTEEVWIAASNHDLDGMRGGFDPAGTGLMVSFGITRAVYINGDLVTQTTLDFGRISDLTPVQAAQLDKQLASMNLVQNGPGNTVQAQGGGSNYGTVIQNSLNNQTIVNQTIINASSNSAGMVRSLNILSTMNDSIAAAIGSR